MKMRLLTSLVSVMCLSTTLVYADNTAPVSGFARSFLSGEPIIDATITILETGQQIKTDNKGNFGPINYPVGKPITLLLEAAGYTTTQSATVIVPKEGLISPYTNLTFQVPSTYVYAFLKYTFEYSFGVTDDPNSCHVSSTILAYHKTMEDDPQGEPGAVVALSPTVDNLNPFYFDIISSGPLQGKTYPFPTGLTKTSLDGGIMLFNVPARDEPYTLSATKDGVNFTSAQFTCRKGAFINVSPPSGPMADKED